MVDLLVLEKDLVGNLTPEAKVQLASIFETLVEVDSKKVSIQYSIELELNSLRAAVVEKDASLLKLPATIPLSTANFE